MFKLPSKVTYILEKLNSEGYGAYVVGGCVRDMIMKKTPHDYDICTAAAPQTTLEIFENEGFEVVPTGIKHGTVSVVIGKEVFEITTFRIDGDYEDGRHPSEVLFTSDINKDLSRRDFTINAIAYAPNKGIMDPFGGVLDIKNKRIKAVGNPNERFNEDALRILRALRFKATLGFDLAADTHCAMLDASKNLEKISKERISSELNKMFEGEFLGKVLDTLEWELRYVIPELQSMVGFNQRNPYHDYDVWQHTCRVVANCPKDRIVRLAALFHDIGKPASFQEEIINGETRYHFKGHAEKSVKIAESILRNLKFSNEDIENILILIEHHDTIFAPTKKFIRRMLKRMNGEENFKKLISLRIADILGQKENSSFSDDRFQRAVETLGLLNTLDIQEECFSIKHLAINGNDLKDLGFTPGPIMGKILNILLQEVMEENLTNTKDELIEFVNNRKESFS